MTVREYVEALQKLPQDLEVLMYDGEFCVYHPVTSPADIVTVVNVPCFPGSTDYTIEDDDDHSRIQKGYDKRKAVRL